MCIVYIYYTNTQQYNTNHFKIFLTNLNLPIQRRPKGLDTEGKLDQRELDRE